MVEHFVDIDGTELEVLRSGVRLMALLALGSADLADEVAQETIVRAFHSLRTSRPAKLGPFVAGIARHVIADLIRARPREVRLDDLASDAEPKTQSDALTALCDDQEKARVREALTQLAPEDRELLRLIFFEGLSPSEIAQRTAVPPERIRQRKLRALLRLRRAFNQSAKGRHGEPPGATGIEDATPAVEPMRNVK